MEEIIQFIQVWWILIICISVLVFIIFLAARVPTSEKGKSEPTIVSQSNAKSDL